MARARTRFQSVRHCEQFLSEQRLYRRVLGTTDERLLGRPAGVNMWEWALSWIAPAATMIGAMMTAANAGARLTGWGFVVFSIGSVAWSFAASFSHQRNLLLTNLFLTVVNLIGVWRWLGRQARHEAGSIKAEQKSREARVPTLFSASAAVGADVLDAGGEKLGVVIDLMLNRDQRGLAYVVIAQYGLGGVGETLRAVDPARMEFSGGFAHSKLTRRELNALPALEADDWPYALPCSGQQVSPGASDRE
jgi:hypothetical protein